MNNNVMRFVELNNECPVITGTYSGRELDRNQDCYPGRDLDNFASIDIQISKPFGTKNDGTDQWVINQTKYHHLVDFGFLIDIH